LAEEVAIRALQVADHRTVELLRALALHSLEDPEQQRLDEARTLRDTGVMFFPSSARVTVAGKLHTAWERCGRNLSLR
jgi:hypothetical protein